MLPMRNDGQPPGGGIAERAGRGRSAEFKTQNSLNALRRKQSALSSERGRKIPRIDRSLEHGGVVFDVKQLELLARLIGEQVRETCRIHALGTQAVVADKQVSSRERRCQCCSIPIDKKGVISARNAVEDKADQKWCFDCRAAAMGGYENALKQGASASEAGAAAGIARVAARDGRRAATSAATADLAAEAATAAAAVALVSTAAVAAAAPTAPKDAAQGLANGGLVSQQGAQPKQGAPVRGAAKPVGMSAGAPAQGAAKQGAPVPGAKKPKQWPVPGARGGGAIREAQGTTKKAQRNKAAAAASGEAAAGAGALQMEQAVSQGVPGLGTTANDAQAMPKLSKSARKAAKTADAAARRERGKDTAAAKEAAEAAVKTKKETSLAMASAVASRSAEQVLATPDEVADEQAATTHLVPWVLWSRIPGAGQPICDACMIGRLCDCQYANARKPTHCLPPFHESPGSLTIPAPVEVEDERRWPSYSEDDGGWGQDERRWPSYSEERQWLLYLEAEREEKGESNDEEIDPPMTVFEFLACHGLSAPKQWPHEQCPGGAIWEAQGLAEAQQWPHERCPGGAKGAPVPGAKKPKQWPHERCPGGAIREAQGLAEAQRNKAAAGARDGAAAAAAAETAAIDAENDVEIDPPMSALEFLASFSGWTVDQQIEYIDVNKDTMVHGADDGGMTLLCAASRQGHVEIAKLLLAQEGVDVNRADDDGTTPLLTASRHGHVEIVKLLLAQESADVDRAANPNPYGTPWHVASMEGHLEVVKLLEEAGAVGGW